MLILSISETREEYEESWVISEVRRVLACGRVNGLVGSIVGILDMEEQAEMSLELLLKSYQRRSRNRTGEQLSRILQSLINT